MHIFGMVVHFLCIFSVNFVHSDAAEFKRENAVCRNAASDLLLVAHFDSLRKEAPATDETIFFN